MKKKDQTLQIGNILDQKCPRCKHSKVLKVMGIYHKSEKSHEIECQDCFYTERVNPENIEFSYVEPKEKKSKDKDNIKEAS